MQWFYLFGGAEYDTAWAMYSLIGKFDSLARAMRAIDIRYEEDRYLHWRGYLRVEPPENWQGYSDSAIYWAQIATVNDEGDLVLVAHWYYLQKDRLPSEWAINEGSTEV